MSISAARLLIVAIAAIATAIWFIAFRFLRRSERICRGQPDGSDDPLTSSPTFGAEDLAAAYDRTGRTGTIDGSLSVDPYQVDGELTVGLDARTLADEIPKMLLIQESTLGSVRLIETSERHIEFEGQPTSVRGKLGKELTFRRGLITIEPQGATRTRITYRITPARTSLLLRIGRVINLFSLLLIVGLGYALWTFVAGSDEPNTRIQSVQMVQVVHALWPPFLFGGLARTQRRLLVGRIETMIRNIEVLNRGG